MPSRVKMGAMRRCSGRVGAQTAPDRKGGAYLPCSPAICFSAAAVNSPNRMPTRAECFMNFSQHFCTHCKGHRDGRLLRKIRDGKASRGWQQYSQGPAPSPLLRRGPCAGKSPRSP